ncbi:MAG: hypothetical protein PHI44_04925 [Candidatus Ratteibacteria bacterium]|nr:hypothetical protein [Candidatus Ratteibacteria bacterium]
MGSIDANTYFPYLLYHFTVFLIKFQQILVIGGHLTGKIYIFYLSPSLDTIFLYRYNSLLSKKQAIKWRKELFHPINWKR